MDNDNTNRAEPLPGLWRSPNPVFPQEDGPTHRYMTASPACWRHFGDLLAAEYSDFSLARIHRLSVDSYAIQHPGDGSRQAIQSVGLHLARLFLQQHNDLSSGVANEVMRGLTKHKKSLIALTLQLLSR